MTTLKEIHWNKRFSPLLNLRHSVRDHLCPLHLPISTVHGLILKLKKIITDHEISSHDSDDEEWLNQLENRCKGALQQFQLQSKLLSTALTPNAALLKFRGSSNLTVDQVLKRRSEFLTTHGLNIISVHPQPGIVAISIARPNRRELHLLDVWKQWSPSCAHGNYELLIGLREEDNGSLFLSPKSNAPHTLIAGSTGSGKSVLMQNIVLAIACTNTPAQAKIVLIDPKLGVDYFALKGCHICKEASSTTKRTPCLS